MTPETDGAPDATAARPLRILVTTAGSSGDVHPFVAVAQALQAHGHDVTMLVNPYFESTVRGAGLKYHALGPYLSPTDVARDNPAAFGRLTGTWVIMRRLFMPGLRDCYPSLRATFEELHPDVVVGHQISFGLPWLTREFGARWVTCVLSPSTLISNDDPSVYPLGPDVRNAPMWRRRAHHWAARRALSFMLDRPMNRFRRELGLPPVRDTLFTEMLSAERVLALFSPAFRPPAGDDPPTMSVVGFAWFERHGHHGAMADALSPELEAFLDAGEPPIVFSLGSVLSHTEIDTFHAALEAARAIGRRAVLVTGHDHADALDLHDDAIRVNYAPYSLLMPRAAANVHHGGIGTTAQALRAGRPMVVLAHAHDQFDNAARVQRLGVGIRLDANRRVRPDRLAAALQRCVTEQPMQHEAARLGAIIQKEDGAAAAATEIERLCTQGGTHGSPRRGETPPARAT